MKALRSFLLALAPFALLSGQASADTVIVNQNGLNFVPADITISVGDTVRWIRNSGFHDVVEGTDGTFDGDEAFFSDLDDVVTQFDFVFDATFVAANPRPGGVYDYFCSPHFNFGMVGTVTVLDGEPGTSFCDCSGGNSPCSNPGGAGEGCANSTGTGATLSGAGSTSALTDDLTLSGSNLLPGQASLLFMGTAQVNGGMGFTFGDGLRCAGGQVTRLGVRIPNGSGDATWGPGLNSGGLWAASDTRHFQIWYRNTTGGPCGNQFNVSNGYSVTFN